MIFCDHAGGSGETAIVSKTVRTLLQDQAARRGSAVFLITPESGEELSYAGMEAAATAVAFALTEPGLRKGDRVATLLRNGRSSVEVLLGAMYGGYVPVPLNPSAGTSAMAAMLEHSGARIVVSSGTHRVALNEAMRHLEHPPRVLWVDEEKCVNWPAPSRHPEDTLPDIEPEDDALLDYTSGSTGRPKGVLVSHRSVLTGGWNTVMAHELCEADRSLCVLPLWHMNAQIVTLLSTLVSGGSVVMPCQFQVASFWDWVHRYGCTWFALTPSIIAQLLHHRPAQGNGIASAATRTVRFARSSSAPLAPDLHRQFERAFALPLLEAMGSTEAGGAIFSNPLPPAERKIGSPGIPFGFEARVVDPQGNALPEGATGEILIRGTSIMKGYFRDPAATQAVLSADGWLRTGDLGWRDDDGYFFITGRARELIIKGGENIAPREIDEALMAHPAVDEAAAFGIPDPHFGEEVAACVLLKPGHVCSEQELVDWSESRLGRLKTPARILIVSELPRGTAGKVQRHLLPALLQRGARPGTDHMEVPEGSSSFIRDQIIGAWSEVLRCRVGTEDNFFSLGGHSLLAMGVIARLRRAFGLSLPLSFVFEHPTPAAQVAAINTMSKSRKPAGVIPRRDPSMASPLSAAQERIWFLELLHKGVPLYNEVQAARLEGPLNVPALEQAIAAIVSRHEMLRTAIHVDRDGRPRQVVHATVPSPWRIEKCVGDDSALQALLAAEAREPFDLGVAPLMRVTLVDTGVDHVICVVVHHIAFDGWSMGVFFRELSQAYAAFSHDEPFAPPPLELQPADHAAWEQERLKCESWQDDLTWWKEYLRDAPALLELPSDRARPSVATGEGARLPFEIDGALAGKLRRLSQTEGVSLFTTVAAALQVLLVRYTGRSDILLGLPTAHRESPDLEPLIGCLIDTQVLRTDLSGNPSIRKHLHNVDQKMWGAHAHRRLPFEALIGALDLERSLNHEPLVQVMLNWRTPRVENLELESVRVSPVAVHTGTSKFDLTVFMFDTGDTLVGELEYSTALFDASRMARLVDHLRTLLHEGAVAPDHPIHNLSILTEAERRMILEEWSGDAEGPAPTACLHQLVDQQAGRTPDAIAVRHAHETLTYAELTARAERLAATLQSHGVSADMPVAICLDCTLDMSVAILGVLKAGGACLPLDVTLPQDRLKNLLADAQPTVLLTHDALVSGLPAHAGLVLRLDEELDDDALPRQALNGAGDACTPAHLAYLLYTSGSTGRPKAVAMPHRALTNLVHWQIARSAPRADSRTLQYASSGFDVSFQEMFSTWAAGGELVLVPRSVRHDFAALLELILEWNVERVFLPTIALHHLALAAHERELYPAALRQIIVAGEALRLTPEIRRFFSRLPGCTLDNQYGPTETHVVSAFLMQGAPEAWPILPSIGRPISGAKLTVLDPFGQLLPAGVPGELYAGGLPLSRGYHRQSELTAERFVIAPYFTGQGERLYRTGDRACWRPDGTLEFLGRIDRQVKVRGHRVEPAEVEAVLQSHCLVREVAVVLREDETGGSCLVAFVVARGAAELPETRLRSHAAEKLPEYMVPVRFVQLESLPLSPNGKVDRLALAGLKIELGHAALRQRELTLTEETLAAIWEDLLQQDCHDREASFFDLGGHSLLVARMVAGIRTAFGVEIAIQTIFEAPTLSAIAKAIESATLANRGLEQPVIDPVPRDGPLPMSYSQERIWQNASTEYLVPQFWHLEGDLNLDALRAALSEIIRRHEILRTIFTVVDGAPSQKVQAPQPVEMPVVDLSGLPHARERAEQLAWEERAKPLHLEREFPIRASVLRLGAQSHWLLLSIHHMTFDGSSLEVLWRELRELYQCFCEGRPPDLPALPLQYADFACWQRRQLQEDQPFFQKRFAYWSSQLCGDVPALQLPFPSMDFAGAHIDQARQSLAIPDDITNQLRVVSRRAGTTLFTTLLAAFKTIIHGISFRDGVMVGSYFETRGTTGFDGVFGDFTSLLPLRTDLSGDPTFLEVQQRVRHTTLGAVAHQDMPLDLFFATLRRQGIEPPPLEIIFRHVRRSRAPENWHRLRKLPPELHSVPAEASMPWGFTAGVIEEDGSLISTVDFDTRIYDADSVRRMNASFVTLLGRAAVRPELRLSELFDEMNLRPQEF